MTTTRHLDLQRRVDRLEKLLGNPRLYPRDSLRRAQAQLKLETLRSELAQLQHTRETN